MSAMRESDENDLGGGVPDPIMTIEDVAAYLRVPSQTVRRWRRSGTGPRGFKMGKRVRYRRSAVDEWIDQRPQDDQGDKPE